MARNELSKDAIKIASLIRTKAAEQTDREIAEAIGIDPSTLCRFKSEHLDKFCAFLDVLGLSVVDRQKQDKQYKALITLAQVGLENLEQ